jgi:hypothetical protein
MNSIAAELHFQQREDNMKNLAFVSLLVALIFVAASIVTGLTGYSYAVLGLIPALYTKHVSNEVVSLVTGTNSLIRIELLGAVALATLSCTLRSMAVSTTPSSKRCNKSTCR